MTPPPQNDLLTWVKQHQRLVTLCGAGLVAVIMVWWGTAELTAPFPQSQSTGCAPKNQIVTKTITRKDVQVSIYNAGAPAGAAGKASAAFKRLGFPVADVGNAPSSVKITKSQVAGPSDTDPATKLVVATLGSATVNVDPAQQIGPGINVFLGPDYKALAKTPPKSMALETPIIDCLTD